RSTLIDPRDIAAAAPIRSAARSANIGSAGIAAGEVLDSANPQLLTPVTIQFLTPTTYSINGAGSFAYTSGGNIDVNGWRVQITGVPAVGDSFTMQSNVGGVGDNRNALRLSGLQSLGILAGGAQSIGEGFGSLVGQVGAQARQATLNRDAQEAIASHSREQMLAASGVNLDEEAADMLRWQQAYQAAAHTITVADEMFQTLMSVVRR
ncbi:MAG: flagellar basal body rod C-terminal domain-containing protein, partial [Steroidobacteraceae bacterium]